MRYRGAGNVARYRHEAEHPYREAHATLHASIRQKLILVTAGVSAIACLAFAALVWVSYSSSLYSILAHKTETVTKRLALSLVDPLWNYSFSGCAAIMRSELDDTDISAVVLRDEKNLVAVAVKRSGPSIIDVKPSEVPDLLVGSFMLREARVLRNGTDIGRISVYSSDRVVSTEILKRMFVVLLVSLGIGFLIATALFFLVDSLVSKRIVILGRAMDAFAEGDHSSRAPVVYDDELSRLGRGFNEMANRFMALYGELRASEEHYHSLFDGVPVGIYRSTPDGRLLDANPAIMRLLGSSDREDLVDFRTSNIYAEPSEREKWMETMLRDEGVIRDFEFKFHRPDGELRWFRNHCYAVRNIGGVVEYYEGSLEDITDIKAAEAKQRQLIAELEQKNEELARFTYTVSHDLKSPLITIKGFLGYLNKEAREGDFEAFSKDLARIDAAAEKMQQLLLELLELSRIGRLQNAPQEIGFADFVREALSVVDGRLRARGVLVTVAEDLPAIYGDRARLLEAVENLIDNAVKFMGDQAQPQIEIGARLDRGEWVYFVRDNGIGIDPRYHERIFALFERLDTNTEGTGMGLTIVKRIIDVHGGRIWVESTGLGAGSTFCFTIPDPRKAGGKKGALGNGK